MTLCIVKCFPCSNKHTELSQILQLYGAFFKLLLAHSLVLQHIYCLAQSQQPH